jgi:hypothetical protein
MLATGCQEYTKPAPFQRIGRGVNRNSAPLEALERANNVRWLIDGVLQQNSTGLAYGAPGTFKSFWAMDMGVAIASGQPWQGRQTEKAAVIYLAAEGGDNVQHRYAGAVLARGLEYSADLPMEVVQMRPRLDEPEGLEILKALFDGAIDRNGDKYDTRNIDRVTEEEGQKIWNDLRGNGLQGDALRGAFKREKCKLTQSRITRLEHDKENAWNEVYDLFDPKECRTVLLIVDTFAKVASDDTKATVARYNRNLLDVQEYAKQAGLSLSVLTIDHTTKSGDTFMGSMAKEGDNDTLIEIERPGDAYSMKVICRKQKDAADFEPLHLDVVKIAIDGFTDGYGRTLETLRVVDGTKTAKLRRAVGSDGDTVSARILGLIPENGGIQMADLKAKFELLPQSEGKKPDSLRRSLRRAIDSLLDDELIDVSGDTEMVTLTA